MRSLCMHLTGSLGRELRQQVSNALVSTSSQLHAPFTLPQGLRRSTGLPVERVLPALSMTCRASTSNAATELQPFHLAFPVSDLETSKEFYGSKLGCQEGRSSASWVDYSLYGHQIVCHEIKGYNAAASHNAVDGDPVPVPHFGMALKVDQFHALADRVAKSGIKFVIEPHLRFEGQPGEQWTMFFQDPSGNALEFKAMSKPENLFAKYFVK